MAEALIKVGLKRLIIITTLFLYIDLIHLINNFFWEKTNDFAVVFSHAEIRDGVPVLPFWAAMIPLFAVVFSTIIFIALFFTTYFYFRDDLGKEEGKNLLIIAAFLEGIKKVYCLKCMMMGTVITVLFLIPALFAVSASYFLADFIKIARNR